MNEDIFFSDALNALMFEDAETYLNPQEIKTIDEEIYSVIWSKAVAQKIFKTKQIGKGKRQYLFSVAQETSAPKFTSDFQDDAEDKITKAESTVYLIGIQKEWRISMIDIDASRNSSYHRESIDTLHMREMTAIVADFKERVLWRGYDILGASPGVLNANAYGIVTATGIQTFEAGAGGDSKVGAAGDGPISVMKRVQALLNYKYEPPFHVVLMPMLYGQFCVNFNTTTNISDIERIISMVGKDGEKLVAEVHITPHLRNVAEAATLSAMAVIANKTNAGEPTAMIVESYPQSYGIVRANAFGIKGKSYWMGGVAVIRPKAIAVDLEIVSLTT